MARLLRPRVHSNDQQAVPILECCHRKVFATHSRAGSDELASQRLAFNGEWLALNLRRPPGGAGNLGLRQAIVDGPPEAAHLLGGGARRVEFGHATAAARHVLVVDTRED
jgi:hypothetical protein